MKDQFSSSFGFMYLYPVTFSSILDGNSSLTYIVITINNKIPNVDPILIYQHPKLDGSAWSSNFGMCFPLYTM